MAEPTVTRGPAVSPVILLTQDPFWILQGMFVTFLFQVQPEDWLEAEFTDDDRKLAVWPINPELLQV